MKVWIVSSVLGVVALGSACQPEEACHGGKVLSDGSCVEAKDAGNADEGDETKDADKAEDAAAPDAAMTFTVPDAGPVKEAPYCDARTPLVDEDKYGLKCDMSNPSTCGSLMCSFGYCNKACVVGDACSCPGGFVCTDFGAATACMPSWGWPCTDDKSCRPDAPICIEKLKSCTSACDPENPKTCPDTWKCTATVDGNVCTK